MARDAAVMIIAGGAIDYTPQVYSILVQRLVSVADSGPTLN